MLKRSISIASVIGLVLVGTVASTVAATAHPSHSRAVKAVYRVTPLVSDRPSKARIVDPNLVNAWGLAAGPTTPWWVADNGTDVSTLYDGTGTPRSLVVSVEGAPTGLVFNGGPGFVVCWLPVPCCF